MEYFEQKCQGYTHLAHVQILSYKHFIYIVRDGQY